MPVDTKHKDYAKNAEKWQRARDASAGQDEIHAGGEKYLSKLADQAPEDYKVFLKAAPYFNATGRTIDGLVGMVMRKEPVVDHTGMDDLIDDIDLKGNSLASFVQMVLREEMTVYRVGALVEYPQTSNEGKMMADKQRLNERPYASIYKTEDIVNWEEGRVNNKMQPILIVLRESYYEDIDAFTKEEHAQYRELRLEIGEKGYYYVQRIYREEKDSKKFVKFGKDIVPLMKGKPLSFIPFFPYGSDENSLSIKNAIMSDLVNANITHYKMSAAYTKSCMFTAFPMLFLKGISLDDNEKIHVGSQVAVVTNNPDADGKYIDFSGSGLEHVETYINNQEKQMAAIGARMLEQQKTGVESEGAMQMRSNGENSVLGGVAKLAADQVSNMLMFMAEWAGLNPNVTVELNTDYMPVGMTAQELTAYVQALQSGSISYNTFYDNMVRGEVVSGARTSEEELALIGEEAPNLASDDGS